MKREQVISRDPEVVSSALVFLVGYLKAGDSLDRFLQGFPTATREQAEAFLEVALEAIESEVTRPA